MGPSTCAGRRKVAWVAVEWAGGLGWGERKWAMGKRKWPTLSPEIFIWFSFLEITENTNGDLKFFRKI